MKPLPVKPKLHVFVCVNKRDASADIPCCADVYGEDIYAALKTYVKEKGFVGIVWITRARCLGFCNDKGATVVFYPKGKWFTHVTLEDIPRLKEMIEDTIH